MAMSPDQFLLFAETLPEPLFLLTGEGEIVVANTAAHRLLGVAARRLSGIKIHDLAQQDPGKIDQCLRLWARSRAMLPASLRLRRADGSTEKCHCSGALIQPRSDDRSALILLRCQHVQLLTRSFVALNEQIERLRKEITVRKHAEEALRESERYNRMLFEQSTIGLALCRMNGELIDINPAYARIIGRGVEETLGLTYWDITPEKYAADEQYQLESLDKTGCYGPYEKEHIHKDGHLVPVRLQGQLLEKGGETFIWSSIEDITEHKRIVQILRSLAGSSTSVLDFERFLQEALDNLTEVYGSKYAFVGQLLPDGKRVRTLAVRAGGQPAGNFEYDLKGTPCQDILDLKMELIPRNASKLYVEDKMLVDMGVESYYGAPLLSAGNKIIGLISVMDTEPMEVDSWSGPLLGVFASRITLELERLGSEQALHGSEQRLINAQRMAHIGNWELDLVSNTLGWSDEIYHMFGMDPVEFGASYQAFLEAIHPEDRDLVNNAYSESVKNRKPYDIIHRLLMKDGSVKYVNGRCETFYDEKGKPIQSIGTVQDITKRVQIEKELQQHRDHLEELVAERTNELRAAQQELLRKERLATLGQLTATVSHELRNPLGTLRTSLYHITNNLRGKKLGVDRALARMDRNITRCDNIIHEMLDFSRIRELELKPTEIDTWLNNVLVEQTVAKGITIKQDLTAAVEAQIDAERLRRAIINIFDNACQALLEMPAAEQRGRVVTAGTRVRDQRLEITIDDTGPGIPADVLPHIFEPLFSSKGFGIGLGLVIVKQIMEQHGGGVEVSSAEGQGTQVVLWLPLFTKRRNGATAQRRNGETVSR